MADLEIRAFGHRFLLVFERMRRNEPARQQPEVRDHLAGSFDVANSVWVDDKTVEMRFGFGPRHPIPED